jgi:hypothetical protein
MALTGQIRKNNLPLQLLSIGDTQLTGQTREKAIRFLSIGKVGTSRLFSKKRLIFDMNTAMLMNGANLI